MVLLECFAFTALPRLMALATVSARDLLPRTLLVVVWPCVYRASRLLCAGCLGVSPLLTVKALRLLEARFELAGLV